MGSPFHHQGRLKGVGVDCVGLIVLTAQELDLTHHDFKTYASCPDGESLQRELGKAMIAKPADEALPGDMLIFWYADRRAPQHVGLLDVDRGKRKLIHTYHGAKKVIEIHMNEFWEKRVVGAYEYPGVID